MRVQAKVYSGIKETPPFSGCSIAADRRGYAIHQRRINSPSPAGPEGEVRGEGATGSFCKLGHCRLCGDMCIARDQKWWMVPFVVWNAQACLLEFASNW